MIELLTAEPNLAFTTALVLMMAIALLEGLATMGGVGMSAFLDGFLPDTSLDVDLDGLHAPPASFRLLGWLQIGRVPILILLIIFLTAFGLIGLFIQSVTLKLAGAMLPALVAAVPATIASLPVVRVLGCVLAKIIPKDETTAVSKQTFIGRVAVVTLGTAKTGEPAQAKLRDQFGRAHYVMVEPDIEGEVFTTDTPVLLIKRTGAVFRAIRNTAGVLVD